MMKNAIPLYEQVYNHVLDQIKTGKLKVGDRVPSEKDLAAQFNVSRITSKKALEKLEQIQLIERSRGKGSFVIQFSTDVTDNINDNPGYIKNLNQGRFIGLVLPDFSDAYGLELVKAIEDACSERQYHLLLKRTCGSREEEGIAIRSLLQLGVDGLIVLPVHGEYYNADLLRPVLDSFPLVLVDRYFKGIPACSVSTDNRKAGQLITEYLLDQQHINIAFLSPPNENTSSIEERIQGFTSAFLQRGLTFNPKHLFPHLLSTLPNAFHPEKVGSDIQVLRDFIAQNPEITAFIACEYNVARILSQALKSMSVEAGQKYTIVCFDSPQDPFGEPPYTHIQQDEKAMGHRAVELLEAQINGEEVTLHNVMDFTLVKVGGI